MAYQTPITIKEAVQKIQRRKYVLPSIQREFVWSPEQIEKLFDSLMRKYPISTFLFWKVEKERISNFQFYEFLKDYHEKNSRHNIKANLSNDEDIVAVLDGQQRLTSLYIALKGTYAKKIPYYRWDRPNAFPKKALYLNLLAPADDIEMEYDFQFLSQEEITPTENAWWFRVGEVLEFGDLSKVMQFLIDHGLTDTSKYGVERSKFATNTLSKLFQVVNETGTISFFQEEGEELDKVLQIFIRINSGGTKLSYSDLLLSVATAQWKEKDAREEIHGFVDEINAIGDGFDFSKDFVLKSCLVMGDFNDVKFKVDNFKKENMLHIESQWESFSAAIRTAVKMVALFGFNRDNLTASNALIPISYFVLKNGLGEEVINASAHQENRQKIKEWLTRALLRRIWGGTPDGLYPVYRNIINEHKGIFPLNQIIERYKGTNKSLAFTEDDLDQVLSIEYGGPLAYSALSLIYPGLNQSFRYHIDHIHPQKFFTRAKLSAQGIDPAQVDEYLGRYSQLPNLQFLQASINVEKNGKHLSDWLKGSYPSEDDRNQYGRQHLLPFGVSTQFEDFPAFFEARKKLMKEQLAKVLGVELKSKPE